MNAKGDSQISAHPKIDRVNPATAHPPRAYTTSKGSTCVSLFWDGSTGGDGFALRAPLWWWRPCETEEGPVTAEMLDAEAGLGPVANRPNIVLYADTEDFLASLESDQDRIRDRREIGFLQL